MSKIIKVNGVEVTCYEDGSVEWTHGVTGNPHRTFGTPSTGGYRQVHIRGMKIRVHRLIAEAYCIGFSDSRQVDHIDGRRHENRPANLRMLTRSENSRAYRVPHKGKTSKYRGVNYNKENGLWKAQAALGGRKHYLGYYDTERVAAEAYDSFGRANGWANEGLNFPY